jgi:hypothetical protein
MASSASAAASAAADAASAVVGAVAAQPDGPSPTEQEELRLEFLDSLRASPASDWARLLGLPALRSGVDGHVVSPAEWEYCVAIGSARQAANRRVRDQNKSAQGSLKVHVQGVLGEHIFARMFGLRDDTHDTRPRSVRTDTFDAHVHGLRIDLKTTPVWKETPYRKKKIPGVLVDCRKSANPAALYALMHVYNWDDVTEAFVYNAARPPALVFAGAIQKEVLCTDSHKEQRVDKQDPNHGLYDVWYALPSELRDLHIIVGHRLLGVLAE